MDKKLNDAIITAAKEMYQTFFGEELKVSDEVSEPDPTHFEMNVIMGFGGQIAGNFLMQCDKTFSMTAADKMLGIKVEIDSKEMRDAAGEFLNMIIGSAKTNFNPEKETFKISPPTVVIGKHFSIYMKSSTQRRKAYLKFRNSAHSFNIVVNLR